MAEYDRLVVQVVEAEFGRYIEFELSSSRKEALEGTYRRRS